MRHVLLAVAGAVLMQALVTMPATAQQEDPAAAAWAAGDHAQARALYTQRVAADSMDVQALHRLGLLFGWEREYVRAIPLLERVVRLAPSAEARTDLANVLAWSGSYDRALAVLDDVIAHAATSDALHTRARFLSWAGRYGEAASAYRALIDADASDAEALRGMARVTTWRGDLKAGERLWRDALAAEPDNADAHVGMSQVLRWRGRSREALDHAEAAARLRPDDRDVLEQLAWAEAGFAPRVAPTFSAETDSDENRLYTAAINATVPFTRRVSATLNGYVRRADGPTPLGTDPTPESRSALAGLRAELGDGWALSAAGGVTDRSAGDPTAVYSAAIASPAWLPVTASAAWSHSVLDATADLMGRDVTMDNVSLSAGAEPLRSLRVDAGFSFTRFESLTSNDRLLGRVGLEVRPTSWLRVRPRVTAFRFENTVQEGYFAPDEYGLAELGIGIDRYMSRWSISAEAAPGAQRIGSDGDMQGALSARARVGYTIAPGREIGIGVTFSELGLERLTPGDAGYRYQAMVLSGSWGF
ncbi:MAG TPA: tetratricopeptide repeat protein [Longimicrobiales bacterium]|nr:tetratricopeptide repeat protein [Longimicrobiales bacterium]